jgi:hypothetical protein
MHLKPTLLRAVSLGALLCARALGQATPLWSFAGTNAGDNFATSVATGGDVDGDGRFDYVVGAYLSDAGGVDSGSVRVYSGATGAVLYTFSGTVPSGQLGAAVAILGDVDQDGYADILAGANAGNYARVWSGRTGAVLYTLVGDVGDDAFGSAVAALGDVDQDGYADFAVGAPESDLNGVDSGLVRVFSGRTGTKIYDLLGVGLSTEFGYAVSNAGRIDADLVPDIVVGTSTGSNEVDVFSGATGQFLYALFGDSSIDWFGTAVAGVGDTNGDGRGDILVGASQGLLGPGYARLFSGVDGSVIRTISGAASLDLFGWSVAAAGDVDGDGRADYAVGAPFSEAALPSGQLFNCGIANVYSGATGALLLSFSGSADDDALGWSLAGAPCGNLIAGAPVAGIAGEARVFDTLQTPGTSAYCTAAANTVGAGASMSSLGTTSLASNDLVLVASGAPPSTFGLFYFGRAATQAVFGNGYRCIAGPVQRLSVQQASPSGTFTRVLDTHSTAIRAGEVWRFQLWYRNVAAGGAGFNLSNGLRALFCP